MPPEMFTAVTNLIFITFLKEILLDCSQLISLEKITFLDFVDRLIFIINTTFRKLDEFTSSGKMMDWSSH